LSVAIHYLLVTLWNSVVGVVGREWSGIEVHGNNEVCVCVRVRVCVRACVCELSQAMKFLPHGMMD